MLYKTITLELLKEGFPDLHESSGGKRAFEGPRPLFDWIERKPRVQAGGALPASPGSQPEQIAAEALEIAIENLTARLSANSRTA